MNYLAGPEFSLRSCALCIVDAEGKICLERELRCEADAMSQHLLVGLQDAGFNVVCMETHQVNAA